MNGIALGIVLASAFLHAGWNYLLKKSNRKIVFIWWFLLASLVLYLPLFLYFCGDAPIPYAGWLCIVATGLIHAAYFWFMGGGIPAGRPLPGLSAGPGIRTPDRADSRRHPPE